MNDLNSLLQTLIFRKTRFLELKSTDQLLAARSRQFVVPEFGLHDSDDDDEIEDQVEGHDSDDDDEIEDQVEGHDDDDSDDDDEIEDQVEGHDDSDDEIGSDQSTTASMSDVDNVLAWIDISLDIAAESRSGPTACSRLFKYLNNALYDSWALFDEEASGSIFDVKGKKKRLSRTLVKLGLDEDLVDDFRDLFKETPRNARLQLKDSLRQAVMNFAAFEVLNKISASLFSGDPIPVSIAATMSSLLDESLSTLKTMPGGDDLRNIASAIASQISQEIYDVAISDGSNSENFFQDTSNYQVAESVFDPSNSQNTLDSTWQPLPGQDPLTPHWGSVQTFAADVDAVVPETIVRPYLESGELNPVFLDELQQIKDLSLSLSARDRAIAEYWEGGFGTSFPPGLWQEKTNQLIVERELGLEDALQVSLRVSQAMFDAGVVAWATKYKFDSVRPVTSMQQYFYDVSLTNDLSGQDWQPYLPTPSFPDVASGHSAFSSAANYVLRDFFGSNLFQTSAVLQDNESLYQNLGFDGIAGVGEDITLKWETFSYASDEAGFSRLLGGMHFADGDLKGQQIGHQVGVAVSAKANQLLAGNQSILPSSLPKQIFGTMRSDELIGPVDAKSGQVLELYGFDGDDLLVADQNVETHLYGGMGVDTFKITAAGQALIRDYEAGEVIQFKFAEAQPGWFDLLGDVNVAQSDRGEMYTDLMFNNTLLASFDGVWAVDDLGITFLA